MRFPHQFIISISFGYPVHAEQGVDSLPDYSKVPGISGSLLSVGSIP